MLRYDRQQNIIDYLTTTHTAKISELAKFLYTSEASIRRDIVVLESAGVVTRVYGGVVLSQYRNEVLPAELRVTENAEKKSIIAKMAAELIQDGDTVIFDNSSTVMGICKHIRKRKNLKIFTNNLSVCRELRDTDITVYCTGGEYYQKRDAFLGPRAESFLRSVNADSVFFSCKGFSIDGILTDASESEISMRRVMMEQSKNHYFLCDSSKIGEIHTFKLCDTADVTKVICDIEIRE